MRNRADNLPCFCSCFISLALAYREGFLSSQEAHSCSPMLKKSDSQSTSPPVYFGKFRAFHAEQQSNARVHHSNPFPLSNTNSSIPMHTLRLLRFRVLITLVRQYRDTRVGIDLHKLYVPPFTTTLRRGPDGGAQSLLRFLDPCWSTCRPTRLLIPSSSMY